MLKENFESKDINFHQRRKQLKRKRWQTNQKELIKHRKRKHESKRRLRAEAGAKNQLQKTHTKLYLHKTSAVS